MSVFLTPDLVPVAGGTYFPPEDRYGRVGFTTMLSSIAGKVQAARQVLPSITKCYQVFPSVSSAALFTLILCLGGDCRRKALVGTKHSANVSLMLFEKVREAAPSCQVSRWLSLFHDFLGLSGLVFKGCKCDLLDYCLFFYSVVWSCLGVSRSMTNFEITVTFLVIFWKTPLKGSVASTRHF